MNNYLLFFSLFITLSLNAQRESISESNSYTYSKYNYYFDFLNVYSTFQSKDGNLTCSTYNGEYYTINNGGATQINKSASDPLLRLFEMGDGLSYYCTLNKILVAKNNRPIKAHILNTLNESSFDFAAYKGKVYFITLLSDNSQYLRSFDGNTVKTLTRLNDYKQGKNLHLIVTDKIYFTAYTNNRLEINTFDRKLLPIKTYRFKEKIESIPFFRNEDNFTCVNNGKNSVTQVISGKQKTIYYKRQINPFTLNGYIILKNKEGKTGIKLSRDPLEAFNTTAGDNITNINYNKESNSYYCGTGTNLLRLFPYIRKYPRIFNRSNSNTVFTLLQDSKNQVWAASYQGALSILNGNKITESPITDIQFMNGGTVYNHKMILLAESDRGVLLFDGIDHYKKIADSVTGFYTYLSRDNKLYIGTAWQGLWFTNTENLNLENPIWQKIKKEQGLKLLNVLTICEDRFGNIWTGRSSQGIAVYNPRTNKAKTWLVEKKEITFGSNATCLDYHQTLWFGTSAGGLCFYNGKNQDDFNSKNFIHLKHPLLEKGKTISFLLQWKDYLILGAGDKILLFDLKQWYVNKTVAVRYLNPMETSFTNASEQNTIFTDRRDESVWFSTSDMVYQWDIKRWLTLPMFKVEPTVMVKTGTKQTQYKPNKIIEFKPTQNSFDILINYQSKDNMPRLLNGLLVKKGEKPVFEHPNLQNRFHFSNLSSGDYVFYVRICQQDGKVSITRFPIKINSFVWQEWWFWVILSLFPIGFIIYYFRKSHQITVQKKRLSQLTLSSLSNQFRPHFMLNALNSIGSQMEDKPHAEKVISRLGESINILYNFTQTNAFTHPFQNEWKLVENIIEIQRLLFIPELEVKIDALGIIPEDYKVPVGLIQIPVENALLHGLRNKTAGNCVLEITFLENTDCYLITITDNGVGRKKASKINNFRKNGNGLKTIFEMIKIINHNQKDAIAFDIIDHQDPTQTIIKIIFNKTIDYDKIKI